MYSAILECIRPAEYALFFGEAVRRLNTIFWARFACQIALEDEIGLDTGIASIIVVSPSYFLHFREVAHASRRIEECIRPKLECIRSVWLNTLFFSGRIRSYAKRWAGQGRGGVWAEATGPGPLFWGWDGRGCAGGCG